MSAADVAVAPAGREELRAVLGDSPGDAVHGPQFQTGILGDALHRGGLAKVAVQHVGRPRGVPSNAPTVRGGHLATVAQARQPSFSISRE